MSRDQIIISGTGCALADYLYTGVRFNSPQFHKYLSQRPGDGGVTPGKLVFTEELEIFSGIPYSEISAELRGSISATTFNIGGPGLVSLINAAQLLDKNEFKVYFYGGSGNDSTAGLIDQLVRKTPLNIDNYCKISEKKTPFTDVLSDETYDNNHGERTFINNIGAAWDYSPEMLGDHFFDSDIVCFGGTALVPQIHDHLSYLLKRAKSNGCLTVVNTVFDFRNEKKNPEHPWPLVDSLKDLSLIDVLIMDCEEALKISGEKSISEAAQYFIKHQVVSFIITNGASNLYAYSNGHLFKPMELSCWPVSQKVKSDFDINPELKGDTTGCGDNFAGGVIASLAMQSKYSKMSEFDLGEAVAWGIASGGFACYYIGGTYIEKNANEKLKIVHEFKCEYNKQISAL